MKKRILLVSPFPPYIGGVSVSVQRLYDHLRYSGYEPVKYNTQILNKRYNLKALKFLKYLALPFYLMLNRRFDVIHFHVSKMMPKIYVSAWRRFFSSKTRFVITIHGEIHDAFMNDIGRLALKGFDRIICVKTGDQKNMPPEYRNHTVEIPAFIPPVINGENTGEFPVGMVEFLKRDTFKILLNGFIIINEKYHDLYGFGDSIRLVSDLKEKGRSADLILVVIGSNYSKANKDYLEELKRYISEHNIEKNVYWVEGVSMELWPLLRKINLLLRPTKSDGDALSIREALYLRTPVIASDVVPRPQGTITYKMNSREDFLEKTIYLMDHYQDFVSDLDSNTINFAHKIIEQYELSDV
jgi:glycosyltransferase involved in cell wall biosynthesis